MSTTCLSESIQTPEAISTGSVFSLLDLKSVKSIALTFAILSADSVSIPEEWDPIWSHWRKKATLGSKAVKMSPTPRNKSDFPSILGFSIFYFIQGLLKAGPSVSISKPKKKVIKFTFLTVSLTLIPTCSKPFSSSKNNINVSICIKIGKNILK